jgi:hypothetical protein
MIIGVGMNILLILILMSSFIEMNARTYAIFNNTANVLRLDIDRDHFGVRQVMLNAYDKKTVSDLEDVFIKDGKSLPACTKRLTLIDAKAKGQLSSIAFNDGCKNVEVLIVKDAQNKFKVEAKVK